MKLLEQISIDDFVKLMQKISASNELPGKKAQSKMVPSFPFNQPEYFAQNLNLQEAAVLIVVFEEENRLKTIIIERMPDAGPHSGQFAFPGGRKEINDKDLVDTAIREAKEEVGIIVPKTNFIATLTPVQIPISGFSVTPVLAYINYVPQFILCEEEVRNVFVLDLIELLLAESVEVLNVRDMKISAPGFKFKDGFIWGATAMVLKELKEILI